MKKLKNVLIIIVIICFLILSNYYWKTETPWYVIIATIAITVLPLIISLIPETFAIWRLKSEIKNNDLEIKENMNKLEAEVPLSFLYKNLSSKLKKVQISVWASNINLYQKKELIRILSLLSIQDFKTWLVFCFTHDSINRISLTYISDNNFLENIYLSILRAEKQFDEIQDVSSIYKTVQKLKDLKLIEQNSYGVYKDASIKNYENFNQINKLKEYHEKVKNLSQKLYITDQDNKFPNLSYNAELSGLSKKLVDQLWKDNLLNVWMRI